MALLDLLKQMPSLNEIKGSFGEWLAKIYAKTFPGALVLHDILIDGGEGHTSQIDLLVVGSKGIYVIEVKMYSDAKVYGDTARTKWYYYNHGRRYEIYNPLKQNRKHVEYLKTFLKDFGDVPCFSVVTMLCEDFKISGDVGENTLLCNSLPAMERAIYKIGENCPEVWNNDKKKEVFDYIQSNQHMGRAVRIEHKESVIAYKNSLEDMKTQKKCPYCKTDLVLRNGKFGEFYGCVNYPKCKYTQKL